VLSGSVLSIYAMGTWKLLKTVDLWHGWARTANFVAIAYVPGTHTLVLGGYDFEGVGNSRAIGRVWVLPDADVAPSRSIRAYSRDAMGRPGVDVRSLAVTPDGRRVATGTDSSVSGASNKSIISVGVRLFGLTTGNLVGSTPTGAFHGNQSAMAFTHDGRYLISLNITRDGSRAVYLIDANTLQVVDALDTGNIVYDLTIRQDGKDFAVGSGNSIIVWSLPPH